MLICGDPLEMTCSAGPANSAPTNSAGPSNSAFGSAANGSSRLWAWAEDSP